MVRHRAPRGFSLVELLIVAAVIGVIAAVGTPFMLSAMRAAAIRAGAEEMASALAGARQLAINQNRNVCVTIAGDVVQYRVGGCNDPVTRSIRLPSGVILTSADNIVFNFLGAANSAVTYTVTSPVDGRTLSVEVLTSGRVRIQS